MSSPPGRRARLTSPGTSRPPAEVREEVRRRLRDLIEGNRVMIFSKSYCPHSSRVKELFSSLGVNYYILELDQVDDGANVQEVLTEISNQKTVPNIFVNKVHVGGCDRIFQAHQNGLLQKLLQDDSTHDYDLIVIGGGSGGLSCAKEAANLGKKVMVLDFVVPSPQGTSWGLGGTCVNVGCIPKKLMHQAALLGHALQDARKYGWDYNQQVKHNWETMREAIQNHIGSLNWGYRVTLREKGVTYVNSFGEFVELHKIKATNKKGQETFYTASKFVIATGERPRYLGIQGDKEYCITSDDLFSLPYCPGNTLIVGASYVGLECAGFLAGLGLDVTVMVRSVLLRGFDQEMAEKVGSYLEQQGVKFQRKFTPILVQQLEKGLPGRLKVVAKSTEGPETVEGTYNTVLLAIGRDSCTRKIGLEKIGVKINEKNGKTDVSPLPSFYKGVHLPIHSLPASPQRWGSSLGRTKGFSSHQCPTRPSSATHAAGALVSPCVVSGLGLAQQASAASQSSSSSNTRGTSLSLLLPSPLRLNPPTGPAGDLWYTVQQLGVGEGVS